MMGRKWTCGIAVFWVVTMLLQGISFAAIASEEVQKVIGQYIAQQERLQGAFAIVDVQGSRGLRWLKPVRILDKVGKAGNYSFGSVVMTDVKSGDLLELDFDVNDLKGDIRVVDIRIRVENSKARYTYDEKSNIVPVQ